jgi:hypothetical protein
MTYAYQGFWSDVQPVRDEHQKQVLYWHYKIFALGTNQFLSSGYGANRASALAATEARIEALARASSMPRPRAA